MSQPHDPKVYEELGRACERNGLGWVGDDGEFLFQAPADVIEEQAAARAAAPLRTQIGALEEGLKVAGAIFRMYADLHRLKHTPEGDQKAASNQALADECSRLLAPNSETRQALERLKEAGIKPTMTAEELMNMTRER